MHIAVQTIGGHKVTLWSVLQTAVNSIFEREHDSLRHLPLLGSSYGKILVAVDSFA